MLLSLQFSARSEVKRVILTEGSYVLGRAEGCELVIKNSTVSRRHCRIYYSYSEGCWYIEDLKSKNGIIINGERVDRFAIKAPVNLFIGGVPVIVEPVEEEDVLPSQLGKLPFVFHPDIATEEPTEITVDGVLDPSVRRRLEHFLYQLDRVEGFEQKLMEILQESNVREFGLVKEEEDRLLFLTASISPFADEIYSKKELSVPFSIELSGNRVFHSFPLRFSWFKGAYYLITEGNHSVARQLSSLLATVFKVYTLLLFKSPPSPKKYEDEEPHLPGEYVFISPQMKALLKRVKIIAQVEGPVLLEGETGVGKEVIARMLHWFSRRRTGPFVVLTATAINEGIAEVELFGVKRGTATGVTEKRGKVELAQGGVLFLDEIGDMPLTIQAKILRFIEKKEFWSVGSDVSRTVDVWIIAATNKDVKTEILSGNFREDLFFRLSTNRIYVPPLRERKEDILPLAYHFGRVFSKELKRPFVGFTRKAQRAFLSYHWPGNVRELQNEMRRLISVIEEDGVVNYRMLSENIQQSMNRSTEIYSDFNLQKRVEELERELIIKALALSGGNKTKAASILGISRVGLIKKMKKYEITS